jgi:hypothetical protein
MSIRALPIALVEEILASFEPVMPPGSSMELTGRVFDGRAPDGGGWFGIPLGSLPWPPMPSRTKWRLAVQEVYEWAARGLGADRRPVRSDEDPFRLYWPVEGARVHVSVRDREFTAEFRNPAGAAVLTMPTLTRSGPRFEISHRLWLPDTKHRSPSRRFTPRENQS